MRIIAGIYKGRQLLAPEGKTARPTTDRLRERIFNILEHGAGPGIRGARVADIFAGTGAMGIEALSRGAGSVLFIEKHKASLDALRNNLEALAIPAESAEVMTADARHLPSAPEPFDLVFMDPPYGRGLAEPALQSLLANSWLGKESLVILEAPKGDAISFSGYVIRDQRDQGKSRVLFLALE